MKPLINLKAFLAMLVILIVSAAPLVAYFRNYTAEPTGHEHGIKVMARLLVPKRVRWQE